MNVASRKETARLEHRIEALESELADLKSKVKAASGRKKR